MQQGWAGDAALGCLSSTSMALLMASSINHTSALGSCQIPFLLPTFHQTHVSVRSSSVKTPMCPCQLLLNVKCKRENTSPVKNYGQTRDLETFRRAPSPAPSPFLDYLQPGSSLWAYSHQQTGLCACTAHFLQPAGMEEICLGTAHTCTCTWT